MTTISTMFPRRSNKTGAKRGPKFQYPWDKWIGKKGHVQVLKQGEDFEAQPHSMNVMIRKEAGRRKVRVSVTIKDAVLVIQNLGK